MCNFCEHPDDCHEAGMGCVWCSNCGGRCTDCDDQDLCGCDGAR